jgi:hypothetical protein
MKELILDQKLSFNFGEKESKQSQIGLKNERAKISTWLKII